MNIRRISPSVESVVHVLKCLKIMSRATRALRLQPAISQRSEGKEEALLCITLHSVPRAGISLPLVELYVDQVLRIINGLL